MAVKGNFSALQQQREGGVDFSKGILDATNIYLKMQDNRRAEEEHYERKSLYKDKREELIAKAYSGEISAIDEMFKNTGYQQPDQALYNYFLGQKQKKGEIMSQYADWRTNPKARAEMDRVDSSVRFIAQSADKIKNSVEEVKNGLQWSLNSKGEKVPPKYSKLAEKELDRFESLLNGDFIIEDYNGSPVYLSKDKNGNGSLLDLNQFNKVGLNIPARFDYDEWFKEKATKLGTIKKVEDKGNRTITSNKFDDIKSTLIEDVKNMIGTDYKNLTDIGKSILVDSFNYDIDKLDQYSEATHEKFINMVAENFRSTYKEETKNEANVQLINSQNTAKYQQGQLAINKQKLVLEKRKIDLDEKRNNALIAKDYKMVDYYDAQIDKNKADTKKIEAETEEVNSYKNEGNNKNNSDYGTLD